MPPLSAVGASGGGTIVAQKLVVPFQSKLTVALCRALVKCSKRFEVQIQRLGLDSLPETELTLLRYLCPSYLKSLQFSSSSLTNEEGESEKSLLSSSGSEPDEPDELELFKVSGA